MYKFKIRFLNSLKKFSKSVDNKLNKYLKMMKN